MSTEGFIRLETAEGGIEYWDGSTKIAFINDSGTVQATRGNADRKMEILPWIRDHYPFDLSEDQIQWMENIGLIVEKSFIEDIEKRQGNLEESAPESAPETGAVSNQLEEKKVKEFGHVFHDSIPPSENTGVGTKVPSPDIVLPIICPIPGDSQSGSKSPEVVAWWFDNHSEQARVKYAKHPNLWPK